MDEGLRSNVALILFLALLAVVPGGQFIRMAKRKRQNFDWYKAKYPNLVSPGRVQCYHCDSTNIGTERLMNRTFLRGHVCRSCGTNLYYSPELQ